jgi:hypothetical protein
MSDLLQSGFSPDCPQLQHTRGARELGLGTATMQSRVQLLLQLLFLS